MYSNSIYANNAFNIPLQDLKANPWPEAEGGPKAQVEFWRKELALGEGFPGESAEFESYVSETYPDLSQEADRA